MRGPDIDIEFDPYIFSTGLSDGAKFSGKKDPDFQARMSARGYITFSENNDKGPYTHLYLNFQPCIQTFDLYRSRTMSWMISNVDGPNLNKTPKEFFENKELFKPFVRRLASVALVLRRLPDMLPDAFPKLEGKFPIELASDLNLFLQNPDSDASVLDSKYGIDISSFVHDPHIEHIYRRNVDDFGPYLEEVLKNYKYD